MHADGLGAIADVSARTFSMVGNCRFPLYITPDVAREWFDTWGMISVRRMKRQGRPFSPTSVDMSDSHPALKFYGQ